MDIQKIFAIAITIGQYFVKKTATLADDAALDLLIAASKSPELIAWLEKLFAKTTAIPEGALPMVDANDPELVAAFNASPEMLLWGRRHQPQAPAGAEPIGLGGIAALIQLLPLLKALWDAYRSGTIGTVK